MYCVFCDVPCIVCVYMRTVLLPPGSYPIAVKYISHHIKTLAFTGIRTLGSSSPEPRP